MKTDPVFTLGDALIYHDLITGEWLIIQGDSRATAEHDELPAALNLLGLDVSLLKRFKHTN